MTKLTQAQRGALIQLIIEQGNYSKQLLRDHEADIPQPFVVLPYGRTAETWDGLFSLGYIEKWTLGAVKPERWRPTPAGRKAA